MTICHFQMLFVQPSEENLFNSRNLLIEEGMDTYFFKTK